MKNDTAEDVKITTAMGVNDAVAVLTATAGAVFDGGTKLKEMIEGAKCLFAEPELQEIREKLWLNKLKTPGGLDFLSSGLIGSITRMSRENEDIIDPQKCSLPDLLETLLMLDMAQLEAHQQFEKLYLVFAQSIAVAEDLLSLVIMMAEEKSPEELAPVLILLSVIFCRMTGFKVDELDRAFRKTASAANFFGTKLAMIVAWKDSLLSSQDD